MPASSGIYAARNDAHTALVKAALEALAMRGITAWPNQTGVWFEDGGRPHKYGKKGSADIMAIIPRRATIYHRNGDLLCQGTTIGQHAEFEAKTGRAVQSENQKKHQKFVVERNGGLYIVFYSVEGLLGILQDEGVLSLS
jgi:hypothetical protein